MDWMESLRSNACFQREFPFESRFVDVLGHKVHYVDVGQGPTLLLLHGNPTFSFLYRHIIRGLKDSFRLVALDYPGFGLSTPAAGYDLKPASHAAVVDAFCDVVGLQKFGVFVQDWGGPIGLWVAGRRAAQVDALLVGNTWAWPVNGNPHFERFSHAMGGRAGGFFIRRYNAFVNVMMRMGTPRHRITRERLDVYRAAMPPPRREATHIFPREILESRAFLEEVERGLGALAQKPALLLWGDKDVAFRTPELTKFQRLFPRHKVVMLPGAGHYVQEDSPDEIVAAVRAWWPGRES